jgi:membrane protease YdiL (CAAX protease family)
MWELWHFTNRTAHVPALQAVTRVAIFVVIGIALSALIGSAVDYTKSIVVAVTLHGWVDMFFEFPGTGTYIVFGCAVIFWAYLLWTWKRKEVDATVVEIPS